MPDVERDEVPEPVLDACREFFAAAHEAIDLGEGHTPAVPGP
ncbi:hypothetical protein [Streptomyces sp. NPDC093094]